MSKLSKNEMLKIWCGEVLGRSSRLGELTFPHHKHPKLSISNYKTKRKISDELWDSFISNMEKIESDELAIQLSRYKDVQGESKTNHSLKVLAEWNSDIHNQSYSEIMKNTLYDHMDKWLAKDRVAKLRMIDLAYLLTYDDCTEVDYASTFVSTLMKNKPMVDIEVDSNIRMLIPHIDMLISQNHVFYIASKQNPEAFE